MSLCRCLCIAIICLFMWPVTFITMMNANLIQLNRFFSSVCVRIFNTICFTSTRLFSRLFNLLLVFLPFFFSVAVISIIRCRICTFYNSNVTDLFLVEIRNASCFICIRYACSKTPHSYRYRYNQKLFFFIA